MKSMTGYGFAEILDGDYFCKIKIHSVNQKYFEAVVRMPNDLIILENKIKKNIQKTVSRGRMNVFVEFKKESSNINSQIDMDVARWYLDLINNLNDEFDLGKNNVRAIDLLKLKEVVKYEPPAFETEKAWALIKATLFQALNMFDEMRKNEGEKLQEDILNRIKLLEEINNSIKALRESLKAEHFEKLNKRLKEIAPENLINENIIKLEFAIFVDRSDITEETTRIDSHINQFAQIVNKNNTPKGRQLDFICQELNREFNTIGSKANAYNLADKVISAKCELEKIREQLQNVE